MGAERAGARGSSVPASRRQELAARTDEAVTLVHRVQAWRPYRAYQRYSVTDAGLLAGGIAFSALFGIAAALTLMWTAFMATLGDDPALRAQVVETVNTWLPGVLSTPTSRGMVDPDDLVLSSPLHPASIAATAVLVWTAVGIMTNIRSCVQTMFGIVAPPGNLVVQKSRDLLGFLGLAVGIVLSSVVGTAASTLGGRVTRLLGLGGGTAAAVFARVGGFALAIALAAVTFAFLFHVVARVRAPRRDLLLGCLLGGIAVHVILTAGTSLVSSNLDNALVAASASVATLLLFVNLLSRVLLYVAAFTANPPSPVRPRTPRDVHFDETPNYVTLSAPETLTWPHQDVTGQVDVQPHPADDQEGSRRPGPLALVEKARQDVADRGLCRGR